MRTVKELVADLGILETEQEAFREDVFAFLDEHTGSPGATLRLTPSEAQSYSTRFINSDRGTVYFARRGPGFAWRHGKSEEEVAIALPDLIKRWFKNRKDTMQKREAALARTSRPKPQTTIKQHFQNGIDRTSSNRTSNREVTFASARQSRSNLATIEIDDEQMDVRSVASHGQESSRSSLEESTAIITPRRKKESESKRASALWSVSPEPTPQPIHYTPEALPARIAHRSESPQTPRSKVGVGLPSPPITSPKRKHAETVGSTVEATRSSSPLPGPSKRLRASLESTTTQETVISDVDRENDGLEVTLDPDIAMHGADTAARMSTPTTILQHETEPSQAGQDGDALLVASFSNSSVASKQLKFTTDALLSVPGTVLDYLRKCERSSLVKANSKSATSEIRKKHQERSRLFRDLHTDIESRLISLSAPEVKDENEHLDSQDSDSARHEISFYSLWD